MRGMSREGGQCHQDVSDEASQRHANSGTGGLHCAPGAQGQADLVSRSGADRCGEGCMSEETGAEPRGQRAEYEERRANKGRGQDDRE